MHIVMKRVPMPEFAFVEDVPAVPVEEYERRLAALYQAAGADWVVIYADREHYANLTFLVNYDPRFEEALLVLGAGGSRVLITGNEGMGYLSVLSVPLEAILCQTFSLGGQPRETAPNLKAVLARLGMRAGQKVSVVGWKYLEPEEAEDVQSPAFIPAFFVNVLCSLVGTQGQVVDGTALMMHPGHGQRVKNSVDQIAAFEWAARNASAAVFRIVRGVRPGMSEMQAMQLMNYAGQPMTMHPIFVSGKGAINGLRSASSKIVEYGDAVSTAAAYWGSLVCRAGMLLGQPDDSFFEKIATPYFRVIATWYQTMRIGVKGKEVYDAVAQAFAGSPYHSTLNPGHLTSFEEWLHSPIRPGSDESVVSGMVFQSDIIPGPLPDGQLLNCEDTVAIADVALRAEIRARHPALWQRIDRRRELMSGALGIPMAEELLPLTDGTAYLPPFWLDGELVCTVAD